MPNWCNNTLRIAGEPEVLKSFVEASQGLPARYPPTKHEREAGIVEPEDTTPYFCFNALVPTPDSVLQVGFDGHSKSGPDGKPVIDGYNWSRYHWGTKWDIYYDHITPEKMGWSEGCSELQFDFYTAYTPPAGWLIQVVEMFPELSFQLTYSEPACMVMGQLLGRNGICYNIK